MSEIREWRFELDEGAAILSLPGKLSKADVEDLGESFDLVFRTLVRLVEFQNRESAVDPRMQTGEL